MKVWIVEATEPLPIDRGERPWRCSMLSQALVASGHEVLWWSSTFDHAHKIHRSSNLQTIELQPGLSLFLLHGPGYRRNVSLRRIAHNRALAKAFAVQAPRQTPPDLIFCCIPTPELADECISFGRRGGIPVVIDVRDLWPDSYLGQVPPRLRKLASLALLAEFRRMRRVCVGAAALTAVSETYLNWALGYARRLRQVHDGVFPLAYPDLLPKERGEGAVAKAVADIIERKRHNSRQILLYFAGVFGTTYDLATVVEAARILDRANKHEIKFVLAGDGEQAKRLRELACGLENVVFPGWLNADSNYAILQVASIGIAPYVDNAPQSLPNKPYEYMAAGLPMLSSLRGELEELLLREKIGLQYRAGDARSLVDGLMALVDNPVEMAAMGRRARRLYEACFSANVVYNSLCTRLEAIAGDKTSSRLRLDEVRSANAQAKL